MRNAVAEKSSMPLYVDAAKCGTAILSLLVLGVILLFTAAHRYPILIGMAVLSWTFGLNHAFDVDHIAAIDNMTRKLIQENKPNTRTVGFFFSLGHSLVVLLMALLTIFFVTWAQHKLPQFQAFGGFIATLVAGVFLLILALVNFIILRDVVTTFRMVRDGTYREATQEEPNKGRINRLTHRLFGIVEKNWHVFIVGFLFGLGFDTATQVAVLATSAAAASHGIPWIAIVSFPILFTAGMTMMDTSDGFFMSTAYKWVFSSPLRKVYYNLTLTSLSILAAGIIGLIEVGQAVAFDLQWNAGFWQWLQNLNFNIMGFLLVGIFVVVWGVSLILWKALRLDERDQALVVSLGRSDY